MISLERARERTLETSHSMGSTVLPATRAIFGTENATAPRSVRSGRWFRGSREGSLHSPARDPRLFYRPLRGRGIDLTVVAESTALRSPRRRDRWRGIVRRSIAAPREHNRRVTCEVELVPRLEEHGVAGDVRDLSD